MHDLVIRGGTVVTPSARFRADVGVRGGKIATLGERLDGDELIDAAGRLVMPGGIETHCHIAQESSTGMMTADDYESGSVAAAFGGNTTIVPFAAQQPGQSPREVLRIYDERARKSVLDFSYHLIVSDPGVLGFDDEMRAVFERGVTSFKVFLTYDRIMLSDERFLAVLATAREHGALTMVHAENNALVNMMRQRLVERGCTAAKYHAPSRPAAAEVEAIARAIRLATFLDAPLFVVHVSTPGGMAELARARAAGAAVHGETCPQYLFLTADDLDRPDGAKFICSPPLRDAATQEALWQGLASGVFEMCSSDHAPYAWDATGKLAAGRDAPFTQVANGMPGIELRLPLLFSEGVVKGRLTPERFVELTSANAARLFGIPGKGAIAIGADADVAIWDADARWTVRAYDMHDRTGYCPFEGMELTGRPETVIQRGRVIVSGGRLHGRPGDGRFLARFRYDRRGGLDAGASSSESGPADACMEL
jgi:dihydropyrimidinase